MELALTPTTMNFLQSIKNRFNNYLYKNRKFDTEEEFYTYLFTKNPSWSSKEPNEDENIRLGEIKKVIDGIKLAGDSSILEIGCGRGWLSGKLVQYGTVTGIEPVEPVVKYAKKLFPQLEFHPDLPGSFIQKFPTRKFDLIVSSEVLEHVTDKKEFMQQVNSLLKQGGVAIITTPRMEHYNDFISIYGSEPGQPVEEWMSEQEVKDLILDSGFEIVSHNVFAPLPMKDKTVYTTQLWAFRKK